MCLCGLGKQVDQTAFIVRNRGLFVCVYLFVSMRFKDEKIIGIYSRIPFPSPFFILPEVEASSFVVREE